MKLFSGLGIGRCDPIQWPPISPDLTPLGICLWGWTKSEVYERKVITQDQLLASILDAANRIKRHEDQLRQQHAIFTHELQSGLRLAVGFSNNYCEL